MRALILAAGVGRRLRGNGSRYPKCLLNFDGRSLLSRHLDALEDLGVYEVVLGVGYRADLIEQALVAHKPKANVRLVNNPDYHQGSIVTLFRLRHHLTPGEDVLLMDADVLYHRLILERLVTSVHSNCFLLDRNLEAGEEPVKVCVRDGQLIEFRKNVEVNADYCGESVGFFRFSGEMAIQLAETSSRFLATNRREEPHEEALRDLLLTSPEKFGFEDITGLPWIEIDFPEDIDRAQKKILPLL